MNEREALNWIFQKSGIELSRETGFNLKTCSHCKWQFRNGLLSAKRGRRFLDHYFTKNENYELK